MALHIRNPEVERLVDEVAKITGEGKTQLIRRALEERLAKLEVTGRESMLRERRRRIFEEEIWSRIPDEALGRRVDKAEREAILGYDEEGV